MSSHLLQHHTADLVQTGTGSVCRSISAGGQSTATVAFIREDMEQRREGAAFLFVAPWEKADRKSRCIIEELGEG